MISIPSSSSFPVGNSITRLITSCVCRNGQQMANARAPALIDARNLAPAKRRPDRCLLFLSLSLLSFSPCFLFFFFLLQKGYCIATYTYSADWPSQVAISGTEAVIFYPFVTLLTLFFSPLVVAIPPRTDGRMGSPPSQSIDPTCPHVWRIEGLGREGSAGGGCVFWGLLCVRAGHVPAASSPSSVDE